MGAGVATANSGEGLSDAEAEGYLEKFNFNETDKVNKSEVY